MKSMGQSQNQVVKRERPVESKVYLKYDAEGRVRAMVLDRNAVVVELNEQVQALAEAA
jgi:hypothetical protein